MKLINDFIARYSREYDFYSQAARLTAQTLERDLRRSGIRCIVTHRAKDITRLEEKCRQRALKEKYETIEEIYEDIVDLAGVRVALYFPGEQDQAEKAIYRLFEVHRKRSFPDPEKKQNPAKKFSGYSAHHYRARLKEHTLSDLDRRYAKARVEIQVASVLMHAWSEVEHDLIYKPLAGDLSDAELGILDQLNGLVIAGELSLRMLQGAGKDRVASNGRFLNHYELAAHLLSQAGHIFGEPVGDSGLGQVDLLFDFLTHLKKETPSDLAPYLASLHDNVEMRPLAEQVIDTLLAEDPSLYEKFNSLYVDSLDSSDNPGSESAAMHQQIGRFMTSWVSLEELLRRLASDINGERASMPTARLLNSLYVLDTETRHEIDLLRRVRNNVVHGREVPPPAYLAEAIERIKIITDRVRRIDLPD
ncbi:GTP pyrophosphokinase family protein [Streptomyces sp. NPDC090119]|uniref:GTP pyrophosphokinase n=1 Tax=Streptomyces sp. NPDC090119 TaxID=3365951 RepID=UPI0038014436